MEYYIYQRYCDELNRVHHIAHVSTVIENQYSVKREIITKWFKTHTIYTEILDYETKVTLRNNKITHIERQEHNQIINSHTQIKVLTDSLFIKKDDCYLNTNNIMHNSYFCKFHNYEKKIIPNEVKEWVNTDGKKMVSKYDNQCRLIETIEYEDNGKIAYTTRFFFNGHSQIIKSVTLKNGKQFIDTYDYDKFGNRIHSEYYDINEVKRKCVSKYDKYNNPIYIEGYWHGVLSIRTYEYKYDLYDNWIERREYVDDVYSELVIRQFKYEKTPI